MLGYFAGEELAGEVEGSGGAAAEPDAGGGVERRSISGSTVGGVGSCGGGPNSGARVACAFGAVRPACIRRREGRSVRK